MPSIQESNPVPVIGHRGYEVGRGSLGDRTALEEDLRRPACRRIRSPAFMSSSTALRRTGCLNASGFSRSSRSVWTSAVAASRAGEDMCALRRSSGSLHQPAPDASTRRFPDRKPCGFVGIGPISERRRDWPGSSAASGRPRRRSLSLCALNTRALPPRLGLERYRRRRVWRGGGGQPSLRWRSSFPDGVGTAASGVGCSVRPGAAASSRAGGRD